MEEATAGPPSPAKPLALGAAQQSPVLPTQLARWQRCLPFPSHPTQGWQDWLGRFGWHWQLPGARTRLDGTGRLGPAGMAAGGEAPAPRAHDGNAGRHPTAQRWHSAAMRRGAGWVPISSSVPCMGEQPHIAGTCLWLNSLLISLLPLQWAGSGLNAAMRRLTP